MGLWKAENNCFSCFNCDLLSSSYFLLRNRQL